MSNLARNIEGRWLRLPPLGAYLILLTIVGTVRAIVAISIGV